MSLRIIVESCLSSTPTGTICSARAPAKELIRIKCGFPADVVPGDVYEVEGQEGSFVDGQGWTWRQIEASSIRRVKPSGSLVEPYLARLPGLGPTRAKRIWEAYGDQALEMLANPDRIEAVASVIEPARPSIGAAVAGRLYSALSADAARLAAAKSKQAFLSELQAAGIHDSKAADRLWDLCGTLEWRSELLKRPYIAAAHIAWKQADHLGQALLRHRGVALPAEADERLIGAVDSAFQDVFRRGDTAVLPSDFHKLLAKRGVDPERAIELHIGINLSAMDGGLLRPRGMAWLEDAIAGAIQARRGSSLSGEAYEAAKPDHSSLVLNDRQADAVRQALQEGVWVISGGAGTGKTSTMSALCDAWEKSGGYVELTCISGKAALILAKATSRPARTCAGFLDGLDRRARLEAKGKQVSDDLPQIRPATMLIVDEASMLDTFTLHRLLTVLDPSSKIILVGDPGQLPPVAPGCVFHDLCNDGTLVSTLSEVIRQSSDSLIPQIAADIRAGIAPELAPFEDVRPGVFHIDGEMAEADAIAARLHDLFLARDGADNCFHLAARNKTVAAINAERVSRRPEGTMERRLGPFANIAIGDPVLCSRNRYADNLRNGQLGKVMDIGKDVIVAWDGHRDPVALTDEVAADVVLAWAMTVHRAQGSSAKRVIVRLEETPLVTREWLYTAATRAIETVVFVGPRSAMIGGVSRRTSRATGFPLSFSAKGTLPKPDAATVAKR